MPKVFAMKPTRGNRHSDEQAVGFTVAFDVIRDEGSRVLADVAEGRVTIPDDVLEKSRSRYSS
jgi:hypothetical protein